MNTFSFIGGIFVGAGLMLALLLAGVVAFLYWYDRK
jgi:hypothetical protein